VQIKMFFQGVEVFIPSSSFILHLKLVVSVLFRYTCIYTWDSSLGLLARIFKGGASSKLCLELRI
jgi:hypothetical protein